MVVGDIVEVIENGLFRVVGEIGVIVEINGIDPDPYMVLFKDKDHDQDNFCWFSADEIRLAKGFVVLELIKELRDENR